MTFEKKSWTVFGSAKKNLPPSYRDEAAHIGRIAALNGIAIFCGGSHQGLFGSLFNGFTEARTTHSSDARIVSLPYRLYYLPDEDSTYDTHTVFDSLLEQQKALAAAGDHLIALPGGIGTRGEIWSAIEELRCNPDYADKHLWLMNIDGAFDALHADIRSTLQDGTTQSKDFTRVHIVDDTDALAACVIHQTQSFPII